MILPGMGIVSEIVCCFSRKRVFGYNAMAIALLGIAVVGFLVWAHHMFVAGISLYAAMIFSLLSYFVAVPSAIKVFNWTSTMYKGSITYQTPMLYAFGFIGLFTIGGLTGLFLAALGIDVHVTDTYFVVAHFHYIMVGGMVMAYLGGMHFWWPKISGRMYPESWGRLAALLVFVGFNLTFFPQFILGYMGMPRRYWDYSHSPEFQILNVLSTAGATILAVGYLLPMIYFLWSMRYGKPAPDNPWNAAGLEWMIPVATAHLQLRRAARRDVGSLQLRRDQGGGPRCTIVPSATADPRSPQNPALLHHFATRGAAEGCRQPRHVGVSGHRSHVFRRHVLRLPGVSLLVLRRFRRRQPSSRAELGTINTAVLICSSLTVAMAVRARSSGSRKTLLVYLILDDLFGHRSSLGSRAIEYQDKFDETPCTRPEPFPSPWARSAASRRPHATSSTPRSISRSTSAMTGMHALHMIIGVGLFAFCLQRHGRRRTARVITRRSRMAGLYWHFVDIVWIYLFPLLYLIDRTSETPCQNTFPPSKLYVGIWIDTLFFTALRCSWRTVESPGAFQCHGRAGHRDH